VFTLFENAGVHSGNIVDPYNSVDQPWNISNYDQDFIDLNNDGFMDLILGDCEGYRIFIQDDPTLALSENAVIDTAISITPNPSNGIVNVAVNDLQNSNISTAVYDVTGKLLTTIESNTALSNVIRMDLRNYTTSGIYFLKFTTETNGSVTKRIVVQ